ncbi:hypothetical protein [Candidatus Neptunochlamydia vexilliferae]|uniref:Transposase n=1 Tax=Candidatus Neptunichlamydia vexilliferae TaxID=1651774 RepID=A0ABS0B0S7_9BACT|nr:hypothetical protein [Candidatus Neptunochlamydia vexilliferae]MBF5059990.1 hypothetical protein [Candidatus Neptunochlamydia vexilliferae]
MSIPSLESVKERLAEARQNRSSRNKFPKALWDDIFFLAKSHSVGIVSKKLNLTPTFLRRKMKESLTQGKLTFQEVKLPPPVIEKVTIKISCPRLDIQIEGPIACIEPLMPILGGK